MVFPLVLKNENLVFELPSLEMIFGIPSTNAISVTCAPCSLGISKTLHPGFLDASHNENSERLVSCDATSGNDDVSPTAYHSDVGLRGSPKMFILSAAWP